MGLMFLIAGVLFFTAAVRGPEATKELLSILQDDFTGPKNFFVWALAVGAVAGLGYIPKMRPLANALFVLVILALILAHSDKSGKNFITQFFAQIRSTERA
jgi:hypothetical protein